MSKVSHDNLDNVNLKVIYTALSLELKVKAEFICKERRPFIGMCDVFRIDAFLEGVLKRALPIQGVISIKDGEDIFIGSGSQPIIADKYTQLLLGTSKLVVPENQTGIDFTISLSMVDEYKQIPLLNRKNFKEQHMSLVRYLKEGSPEALTAIRELASYKAQNEYYKQNIKSLESCKDRYKIATNKIRDTLINKEMSKKKKLEKIDDLTIDLWYEFKYRRM